MKNRAKTLLKEAQIRRMMGLAGIPAIREGEFIDSYRKQYFEGEEEELPVEEPAADPAAEELPAEEPVEGEPAAMDAAAPADEANVEELVQAIASAITDTTGVEVDAGGAEAGAEELPVEDPMAGAEEDPMAAAEEPAPEEEMPMAEANLAKALAAAGIQLNLDNNELVAEVTKRVAARLVREARKSKRSAKK
jgi:hypothetical protein